MHVNYFKWYLTCPKVGCFFFFFFIFNLRYHDRSQVQSVRFQRRIHDAHDGHLHLNVARKFHILRNLVIVHSRSRDGEKDGESTGEKNAQGSRVNDRDTIIPASTHQSLNKKTKKKQFLTRLFSFAFQNIKHIQFCFMQQKMRNVRKGKKGFYFSRGYQLDFH